MPIIALGDVVAAAVVLALIIGVFVLRYAVSHAFPDVPIIGGAIKNAINSFLGAVASALRGALDGIAIGVGFFLQGIALIIWWTAALVVNGAELLLGRIGWLTGYTQGLYNRSIGWTNSRIGWLTGYVQGLYNRSIGWTNSRIGWLTGYAQGLYNQAVSHADGAATNAIHVAEGLYNRSVAYTQQLYHQAVADYEGLFNRAETDIRTTGQSVLHDAENLYNQAIAHTASVASTLTAEISTGLSDAETAAQRAVAALSATVTADVAQAETDIRTAAANALAQAEGFAGNAAAGAVSVLDHAAHDLVIGPWEALLGDLGTVADALPAEVAGALNLPGVIAQDVPASIPGILAMVVPAVGALAAETAECTVPMCRNLGGLSHLLQDLGQASVWAALVALMVEAVHDPAAAVDGIESSLGTVVNATATATRDLIGV